MSDGPPMRPDRDPADVVPVFAERGNDFGTHLETAGTDGGAENGREPRRRNARLPRERAGRLPGNPHQRTPPARMNSRYRAGDGVREQHRNAIGGLDGDADVGGTSDQRIPRRWSRVPRPISRYLHAVAVHLPQGMEDVRTGGVFKEFQISFGLVPDPEKRGVRLPVPYSAGEAVEGGEARGDERFDRLSRSDGFAAPDPNSCQRKPSGGSGKVSRAGRAPASDVMSSSAELDGGSHVRHYGERGREDHPCDPGHVSRPPPAGCAGLEAPTGRTGRRSLPAAPRDVEQCAVSLRFAQRCRPPAGRTGQRLAFPGLNPARADSNAPFRGPAGRGCRPEVRRSLTFAPPCRLEAGGPLPPYRRRWR